MWRGWLRTMPPGQVRGVNPSLVAASKRGQAESGVGQAVKGAWFPTFCGENSTINTILFEHSMRRLTP